MTLTKVKYHSLNYVKHCERTVARMVIWTCIELLLLTRLVSVNIVLWQQNLKFSFRQQTVEFGPTHICSQIYAPVCHRWWSRDPGVTAGRNLSPYPIFIRITIHDPQPCVDGCVLGAHMNCFLQDSIQKSAILYIWA